MLEEYKNKIICGDCLEVMKKLPDKCVDSIVTDPPYELGFMGKSWDNTGIANNKNMWSECLRVLKPGGHLLAFSGTRTYHRMACAIEDAGFEVRDMVEWVYGSGFPKSLNIGKAVDKLKGNERTPYERPDFVARSNKTEQRKSQVICGEKGKYTKGTSEWEGWGTATKPAHEPIAFCSKPLTIELVFAKMGIDITNNLLNLCQKYNVNVKDAESNLNSILLKLEKVGVNTVAENARMCDWENIENAVIVALNFMSQKHILKEKTEESREVSAQTNVKESGNNDSQEKTIQTGKADNLREQMATLQNMLATETIGLNTILLWKEVLEGVLEKAKMSTISTALEMTTGLKICNSLLKANTQNYTRTNEIRPNHNPICMARKPLAEKTVAENCLKWGTGGINIDQSRVITPNDEARKQKILAGEVICNAFCDKHGLYPSSFHDIISFSPLQLLDFLEHTFSEQDLGNIAYISSLRNLGEIDYKNCKQLLGVPCDYGRLEQRVDEYVRQSLQSLDFLSDYPTLYRLCGVYSQSKRAYDLDIFPLDSDVRADIHRFLSLEESILLCDNNLPLVFVLVCLAYSLLVNNNLHNHYTTCKNKIQAGRFPANLIHDGSDEVKECFPDTKSGNLNTGHKRGDGTGNSYMGGGGTVIGNYGGDSGNASRFFRAIPNDVVDYNDFLIYNRSILTNIKQLCGQHLTKKKTDTILDGVIQEAEKFIQDAELLIFGNSKMEKFLTVTASTIKTLIAQMTELKTLNVLPNWLIMKFTEDYEKTIKLLKELNTEDVKNAESINRLIAFKREMLELIRDIARNVVMENYESGKLQTENELMLMPENTNENTKKNIGERKNFKSIIYQAKASKSERNKGCEDLEEGEVVRQGLAGEHNNPTHKNNHPTVKPIALMEYLIKMVTPKGGTVLDPFAGSGSTLIASQKNGFNYIGIEKESEYVKIAEARLTLRQKPLI